MKNKLLHKDAFFCMLFSFIIIGLASLVILNLSIFNPFTNAFKDFSFLDIYYSEKMGEPYPVNQNIILVNVEHRDRFELAELLSILQKQQPKTIGVDLIFKEQREAYSDSLLKIQLGKANVINSYAYVSNNLVKNNSFFLAQENTSGFSNINFDRDEGVIRNVQLQKKKTEEFAFSTAIAKNALSENDFEKLKRKFKNKQRIKFFGNQHHFLTYSFDEVLEKENHPLMKGKIIMLGYLGVPLNSPFDVEDKHFTPLNEVAVGKSIPDMNGVVIQATILEMLLNNDFITDVPLLILIILTILLSYLSLLYFLRLNKRKRIRYMITKKIAQLLFTVIFLYVALYLLQFDIYLNATPIIAIVLLSVECIAIYVLALKFIKSKLKWKSYILD